MFLPIQYLVLNLTYSIIFHNITMLFRNINNICNILITVEASLKNFNETPHFEIFIHKKKYINYQIPKVFLINE